MSLLRHLLLVLLLFAAPLAAAVDLSDDDGLTFDDEPLTEDLVHPVWFKTTFLNLRDDLQEAVHTGKRGLIVYYGQKRCAYCEMLMKVNFAKADIADYTQKYFDVVALDIRGERMVTPMNGGRELSERKLAAREKLLFTPSLVFYDARGREALRLRGYYPPYRFRAALEYVADGHYRRESFRSYLARADVSHVFEAGGLNEEEFFSGAPYLLARHQVRADRPLVVFFEQGDCHACDVLHSGPLQQAAIRRKLAELETVQLDMWADTPVVTPAGEKTTSRAWADKLGLFYAPTLLVFDEQGKEIMRVDSVVRFYRLNRVLDYIASGDYRKGVAYQEWRKKP